MIAESMRLRDARRYAVLLEFGLSTKETNQRTDNVQYIKGLASDVAECRYWGNKEYDNKDPLVDRVAYRHGIPGAEARLREAIAIFRAPTPAETIP